MKRTKESLPFFDIFGPSGFGALAQPLATKQVIQLLEVLADLATEQGPVAMPLVHKGEEVAALRVWGRTSEGQIMCQAKRFTPIKGPTLWTWFPGDGSQSPWIEAGMHLVDAEWDRYADDPVSDRSWHGAFEVDTPLGTYLINPGAGGRDYVWWIFDYTVDWTMHTPLLWCLAQNVSLGYASLREFRLEEAPAYEADPADVYLDGESYVYAGQLAGEDLDDMGWEELFNTLSEYMY